MNSDRETILARVRGALAPLSQRASLPHWDAELVAMRRAGGAVDAWAEFAERLRGVHGTPLTTVAELVTLLEQNGWRHGYCDPVLWPRLAPAFPAEITVEMVFDRTRVDEYQFGITRASAAVAETGTVVLTDRDTSCRLGALAPWVHVAVITRSQVFADLLQAVTNLPDDPNVVWCTGPSKTADVEGILVEGVHGPGVQAVLLLDRGL